ncbi:MAG TPA: SprT family zinc-dependent metalloprotease [Steroidobacteraceae bacterium]|nr:SprT family zinc-dependent metalloprotease [Steroidobacteraceae bacterium]
MSTFDDRMLRQLELWDPSSTEQSWSVRRSARARRLSVRVFRNGGVEIVVPPRTSPQRVSAFVSEHREWIERQRRRSAAPADWPLPPPTLALTAIGEQWRCVHHDGAGRLHLREAGTRELTVDGDLAERERLRRLLNGWLVERALQGFQQPLQSLARQMGADPTRMQVRCQRTRWGSCSRRGTISLNACLLFQRPEVLRYLMIHELAHLKHMNHSARFWLEVSRHEPGWKTLDRELLQGWRRVPSWIFK